MSNLDYLFDLCKKNAALLSEPFASGPAVSCTRTFTILPLRYAAVGGNSTAIRLLPELPEHLRAPHAVSALTHAGYAIRTLREGFLYVLEKRASTGLHTWHTPYRVDANGALSLTAPGVPWTPAPPSSNPQDFIRAMAWTFAVHDLDDLQELRLFYSPDPLTLAAMGKLKRDRAVMPAVDIARLAGPSCASPEPNVLTHADLDYVADFAAEGQPRLRAMLAEQALSAPQIISRAGTYQQLKPADGTLNPRGVAIVVEDAIGITQELNAWRNAALEHLKCWLETTEAAGAQGKPGPSNERKVLVAQAFTELHTNFSKRKVAAQVRQHTQAMRTYLQGSEQAVQPGMQDWWEHTRESILEANSQLKRDELQARAHAGEFDQLFNERYLPRVDLDAMHTQLAQFDSESQVAQAMAEARAADHLAWLQHPNLLNALAAYDPEDLRSGVCFAHQAGLCVIGMEGVARGAQLIAQWWKADSVHAGNLALRSFVFNQRAIADVLERTRSHLANPSARGDDWQLLDTALKQSKELAAEFSRVDGQLDLIAQHGHVNAAGALAWLGQLGREALRAGAPNSLDRALHRRLSAYLVASLGAQAVDLRMMEHAQAGTTASPGRTAAPIIRRLDQAYVNSLRDAHSNDFYRLRVASGLLLLEASLLLLQGHRETKDQRFWSEVLAAGLTSAAAGIELLAVGTEQALSQVGPNSVTARGASISLGRYRLWGGGVGISSRTGEYVVGCKGRKRFIPGRTRFRTHPKNCIRKCLHNSQFGDAGTVEWTRRHRPFPGWCLLQLVGRTSKHHRTKNYFF
ncbi:hypothetical protein G3435_05350 [Pseudomonas sp. MAFF212428]|uniref:Toxin VasX N-terminal region domain-containing protein n=1 Tax=Pseudomonas brassicae TaxID=2708063 RepID=A0A6M0CST4_9PSED|nr:hypothetical protein [Pseudomonas brassicae]